MVCTNSCSALIVTLLCLLVFIGQSNAIIKHVKPLSINAVLLHKLGSGHPGLMNISCDTCERSVLFDIPTTADGEQSYSIVRGIPTIYIVKYYIDNSMFSGMWNFTKDPTKNLQRFWKQLWDGKFQVTLSVGFSCPYRFRGPGCECKESDLDSCLYGEKICAGPWTNPAKNCTDDEDECSARTHLCKNRATCVNTYGSYKCNCADGFKGRFCETSTDICVERHPCKNNGTCVNLDGDFQCICPGGRSGKTCEEGMASCEEFTTREVCREGGMCFRFWDHSRCYCRNTNRFQICKVMNQTLKRSNPIEVEIKIRHLLVPNIPGTFNITCDTCLNTMVVPFNFACPRKSRVGLLYVTGDPKIFTGTYFIKYFRHTGTLNFKRKRNSGFEKFSIKVAKHKLRLTLRIGYVCPDNSNGPGCECSETDHYKCRNGHRVCREAWSNLSKNCTEDANECKDGTHKCKNGATCVNTFGSYNCTCTSFFRGRFCDIDIDECAEQQPCKNNGRCSNMIGNFECVCPGGRLGRTCEYGMANCEEFTIAVCKKSNICYVNEDGTQCFCSSNQNIPYCPPEVPNLTEENC